MLSARRSTIWHPLQIMTSSSDTPPNYDQDRFRVVNDWETAHNAALELFSLQAELIDKEVKLAKAQRILSKLKEQSAAEFSRIHSKKGSLSKIFSFGRSKEQTETENDAQASFEKSHSEERQQAEVVEELQSKVKSLTSMRATTIEQAAASDSLWSRMLPTGHIPTAEEMDSEEALQKADSDVEEAHKQVETLSRARLSIQHAHKYFSDALKVSDDLNPASKGGALSEGMGGDLVNMSKQNDYKAAIRQAEKAQTCLDECIRCLETYWYTVPSDYAADFDALKTSGITQMKRIYDLMYDGSGAESNVRGSVRTMLERQENAYKHLTRAAVWTQERVPECEIAENQAKLRREEARGRLAAFWKKA
ncbi:hypothetical protein SCHPADRAFT_923949 [Schizopora paradoxa]|uniref:Uncharacterized protein n=1 Tax=Schizopora paradoxa TaxID=27342 RepID=A0A0H2S7C2_9AGAM|nr:hypothetical protein SCHPADRAFT_923949 [Schizopora paradoxa]